MQHASQKQRCDIVLEKRMTKGAATPKNDDCSASCHLPAAETSGFGTNTLRFYF